MTDDATVDDVVSELTREEKLSLVHGAADPEGTATGYLPGVERLGVPELRMADGPLGVRVMGESSTAFPAPLALAASFDPELGREVGAAIARETKVRGQDVLLAPGVNIVRTPHNGRNFEYYSEDLTLASAFAAAVVEGVEGEDVISTPKHYVANNQETNRVNVSVEVDERTLREVYLRPFRAAVEAGAGSVMTGYNRVNGTHMSDHEFLLSDVLKGEWGFEGYVVSDWYGTESTVGAANAGLDVEMPGVPPEGMGGGEESGDGESADGEDADGVDADEDDADGGDYEEALAEFMESGGLPDMSEPTLFGDALDEAIDAGEVPESRLDDMVRRVLGQMDRVGLLDGERDDGAIDTPEHRALAQRVAARGTVLLEDDGVLPLDDDADVALIGPNVHEAMLGGGGSSEMTPFAQTSPADGLTERGEHVTVTHGHPPVETPTFLDAIMGEDGDDDEEFDDVDVADAVAAAEDADVAVVVVRDAATEAMDRDSLALPEDQNELVSAVADANENTVAVVNASGPVELPWHDDVAATLTTWYPGQADGDALASVLYGDSDPGGRLPVTLAPAEAFPTASEERFPGVDGEVRYDEGLFVGYRHFDAEGVEPTYPFGHGHSYAEFSYGDVTVDDGTVAVTVTNESDRDGREVVQAYVRPPEGAADRPERELAGFAAVAVPAGDSVTAAFDLDEDAIGRYDEAEGWTVESGTYALEVGRSSRDVRETVEFTR